MNRILHLCLPLSLLLFSWSVSAQESVEHPPVENPVHEIATPRYHLVMPVPIETTVEEKVQTPWGKATVTTHMSRNGMRSLYIFRDFSFSSNRSPSVAKLKKVRSSFLQARKCFAKDATPPPVWNNAKGKPWPQTLFAGSCAAPEQFMVLTAIVDGHVYQLHVVQGLQGNQQDLATVMTWLISQIKLVEK